MGDCVSKVEIPTYNNDTKSNYEGHSGNQYQYDLNKSSDKNEYSLDLEAQRRDQIQGGVDAGRQLDNLIGQQGDGFYGREN